MSVVPWITRWARVTAFQPRICSIDATVTRFSQFGASVAWARL